MGCCDLKTLSLIVAWLQTVFSAIGAILFLVLTCSMGSDAVRKSEYYEQYGEAVLALFIIALIICLLGFALCVTLIIGINKDRHRLMAPYVYLACGAIVLGTIGLVLTFVMGLVNKKPFGDVFIGLIRDAFGVGFQVLFLAPIYLLYKKIRDGPILPEQHRLGNNEPLNKPQYAHGGQV